VRLPNYNKFFLPPKTSKNLSNLKFFHAHIHPKMSIHFMHSWFLSNFMMAEKRLFTYFYCFRK
jgi:hypothetical protein